MVDMQISLVHECIHASVVQINIRHDENIILCTIQIQNKRRCNQLTTRLQRDGCESRMGKERRRKRQHRMEMLCESEKKERKLDFDHKFSRNDEEFVGNVTIIYAILVCLLTSGWNSV